MEMYLQFGYGMMEHCRSLLKQWGSGGVILSPRDLNPQQLKKISKDIKNLGGEVLLDPQCYIKRANHSRLISHDYIQPLLSKSTGAFIGGSQTEEFLKKILTLGQSIGVDRHILPFYLTNEVREDWVAHQKNVIEVARKIVNANSILSTIALESQDVLNERQIEFIVSEAAKWDVDGFYVVAEPPNNSYLIDNPVWLSNFLNLISGLKLLNKTVIVGYSSHQMLCLCVTKVDIICSGTWLNVRSFSPNKFFAKNDDETSRRSIWYYCPQSFSEYKLPFLDIAKRSGLLQKMAPHYNFSSKYSQPLFSGADPTSIEWGERYAFRHYLTSLRAQTLSLNAKDYKSQKIMYTKWLENAENNIKEFTNEGIRGSNRCFLSCIDACRTALEVLDKNRGPLIKRKWNKI